jgi:hypothetical protein
MPTSQRFFSGATGLEPATSGVTGRRSLGDHQALPTDCLKGRVAQLTAFARSPPKEACSAPAADSSFERLSVSAEPSPAAVGVLLPHSYAAMRLRLSNPDLVPELLEFLESRVDVVTKQVSDNEVELSLLGSYNEDAAHMTVDLLVRAWQAGRADEANVELVE